MPLTYTRVFRIRHYECDAYGHVNNANYLRYMQEAAFDASAAAGWTLARYDEIGRHWLIRESDVEFLKPLRYGDSVEVKTWVLDFRRVRSRRAYEFRHIDTGGSSPAPQRIGFSSMPVRVAQRSARPDGVLPRRASRRLPRGIPSPPPPSGKLPSVAASMARYRSMKHVNNATYLAYGRRGGRSQCGIRLAMDRMVEQGLIIARRHRIEYRLPAVKRRAGGGDVGVRPAPCIRALHRLPGCDAEMLARRNDVCLG
jgi:YbgC/YbaW family acyl-CoA thioester hydrolase